MILNFDSEVEEMTARGGSFDLTGTAALTSKQFWGFEASSGAVLNTLKGVKIGTAVTTLAAITSAEIDVTGLLLTGATDALFGSTVYRVDGYIITNVKLTSGSLHLYKIMQQIN